MKKVLYLFAALVLLTGCSCTANMGNTPTKKVEEYLNKYQTNDDDVLTDLDEVLTNDISLTDAERSNYSDFMKTHYRDMQYEIKDETIDGDSATVNAEITVRSYADAVNEANDYRLNHADEFDSENTFASYRLDRLKEVTDTETYTITFHLTKDNEEWKIDDLSDDDLRKISGLYGVTDVNAINDGADTTTDDGKTDNNDNGIVGDAIDDISDGIQDTADDIVDGVDDTNKNN